MKTLRYCTDEELADRNRGLQEIQRAMVAVGVRFMLYDGVLLGAVREKNFIRWDWDVELALFSEQAVSKSREILEALDREGFQILNVVPDFNNFKINVQKYGTKYSMIGYHEEGEVRRRENWQYPKAFFDRTEQIEFLGSKYEVPSPPEAYLEFQYGDWKTPKKSVDQNEYLERRIWTAPAKFEVLRGRVRGLKAKFFKIPSRFVPKKKVAREPLFIEMLQSSIKDGTTLVEVGSSDAEETKVFLQSKHKNLKAFILEPDLRSREKIEQTLRRVDPKNSKVKVVSCAISNENKVGEFFLNKEKPHLNTAHNAEPCSTKIEVEYKRLDTVFKENGIKPPLILKMDIEGHEVEALDGAMEFLKNNTDVSILIELHPWTYGEHHSLEDRLSELVKVGYRFKFVESAAMPVPFRFQQLGLKPQKVSGYRALYENVKACDAIELACNKHFDVISRPPGFTNKIVRSVMLER